MNGKVVFATLVVLLLVVGAFLFLHSSTCNGNEGEPQE